MNFWLLSITVLIITSLFSFFSKDKQEKRLFGCGGTIVGSLIGLLSPIQRFQNGATEKWIFSSSLPHLKVAFGIDSLSAFFLVPIFGLSLLTGLYAWGYVRDKGHLISSLPFFPLLVATMAVTVAARDGLSFLICWELMSLSSLFLVMAEHEIKEVRHAGWIYLVATHVATAFLIVFFILLSQKAGSLTFDDFTSLSLSPFLAGSLFIMALIGFGAKAGIFPLHVWLPHAHPAAPSYISALMSGILIKMGIYGIFRSLTFLGSPPLWWGSILILLGIVSAVLGVLYALMQHDLKRLLAYHSVENIGIIVIGMGLGLIGMAQNNLVIEGIGLTAALFHVWNHALFKGLLFLGAGNVAHATHTYTLNRLGGLLKKMPVTAVTFLIGSLAICGLPPFNGFMSEWLLYMGLFRGSYTFSHFPLFLMAAGILGIALAGGLAMACFAKVFGIIFLGEPRSPISDIKESPSTLTTPLAILAFLCLGIGLFPQMILPTLASVVQNLDSNLSSYSQLSEILSPLRTLSLILVPLLSLMILFALFYRWAFRKKTLTKAATWDCGYAFPSPRMQYTASSFAEPLGTLFRTLLKPVIHFRKLEGFFPATGHFEEQVRDLSERAFFTPLFEKGSSLFSWIRKRQRSRVQDYLALIFITLIFLLIWEVWLGI